MHLFPLYFFFRYSHTAHVVNDHLVLVGGVSPNSTRTPGVVLLNLKSLTWKSFSLPVSAFLLSQYSTILAKVVHDFAMRLRACLHGSWGPQIGEVTCGGSPHLLCKRDQIKMRDSMDRQVTPPKQVTSPTWGPPPPCKQALRQLEPAHTITQEIGSGPGGGPDPAFPLSRCFFTTIPHPELQSSLSRIQVVSWGYLSFRYKALSIPVNSIQVYSF